MSGCRRTPRVAFASAVQRPRATARGWYHLLWGLQQGPEPPRYTPILAAEPPNHHPPHLNPQICRDSFQTCFPATTLAVLPQGQEEGGRSKGDAAGGWMSRSVAPPPSSLPSHHPLSLPKISQTPDPPHMPAEGWVCRPPPPCPPAPPTHLSCLTTPSEGPVRPLAPSLTV